MTPPGLTYFVTGNLYLLTSFTHLTDPPTPTNLFSEYMNLAFFFKGVHL